MKILRELLESLVKSGAWGSLEESSAKMFRQAGMHQAGVRDKNKALRLAQKIKDDTHARRTKAAEKRQNKKEKAKAAKTRGERAEQHAKRYEGELETLKDLKDGGVVSVVLRTKEGSPGEEHHIVRHQGSFHLVGPKGNSRQISGNFGSVVGGAINITSVPKGRGNAKTIGQIEVGRQGGIIDRPGLKYTVSGGRIKVHTKD
jgi:hypothetical protein